MKLEKKHIVRDFALVFALLALAFGLSFFEGEQGNTVEIYADGRLYASYPLNENRSFTVETEYGKNTVVVENGTVRVSEASCGGKDCVKSGRISKTAQCISCLPNKFTVTVIGKTTVDGVTGK